VVEARKLWFHFSLKAINLKSWQKSRNKRILQVKEAQTPLTRDPYTGFVKDFYKKGTYAKIFRKFQVL
jgi:hypothetical protein